MKKKFKMEGVILISVYELPWFKWNNVDAKTYGVQILTLPPIETMPLERTNEVTIPGRSGSLTITEGDDIYDKISLSCSCIMEDTSKIASFCAWMKGYGTAKFSNRPNGYYKGRVSNQISFDKVLRGYDLRTFSIQLSCDPFFYLDSGNTKFTVTTNKSVTNPGNVRSLPLIKVTGTGEGSIMCGGSTMLIDDFSNISYIMLDCESKLAYKGSKDSATDPLTLLNTRVSGDWLSIPAGSSFISISGGVKSIEVTPRWRTI